MAESIDDLCRQHQLSFDDLVERSGLDPQRVQAIFMGRWTPSPAERQAIASVFELSIDEIRWGHKTPIQHLYGQGPA